MEKVGKFAPSLHGHQLGPGYERIRLMDGQSLIKAGLKQMDRLEEKELVWTYFPIGVKNISEKPFLP